MAFETTTELAEFTEKELGETSLPSSDRTDVVSHLDLAHKIIVGGGGLLNIDERGDPLSDPVIFGWARSRHPKVVNFGAPITSGFTVSATQDSSTITFNSDPNSGTSVAGWFIRMNDDDEVYRITAHTAAATSATIDAAYVQSTISAKAFKLFQLQYSFGSDVLLPITPFRVYANDRYRDQIAIVDRDELEQGYPLFDVAEDFPDKAAMIWQTEGTFWFHFSHYPAARERMEMEYVPVPTTLDTSSEDPIIPKHHRLIVADLAVHLMMVRNEDNRAPQYFDRARRRFEALKAENEHVFGSGDPDLGRVIPNINQGPMRLIPRVKDAWTRS